MKRLIIAVALSVASLGAVADNHVTPEQEVLATTAGTSVAVAFATYLSLPVVAVVFTASGVYHQYILMEQSDVLHP